MKTINEKLYYEAEGFELKGVTFDVEATASYYYQPMVMYFADGSGQPEEEDFEIDEMKITNAMKDGKPLAEEEMTEFESVVEDWLYNLPYDEWKGWIDEED